MKEPLSALPKALSAIERGLPSCSDVERDIADDDVRERVEGVEDECVGQRVFALDTIGRKGDNGCSLECSESRGRRRQHEHQVGGHEDKQRRREPLADSDAVKEKPT